MSSKGSSPLPRRSQDSNSKTGWTGSFLRLESQGSQLGSRDISGDEPEAPGEMVLALTTRRGHRGGSQAVPGGQPLLQGCVSPPSLPLAGGWGPKELF